MGYMGKGGAALMGLTSRLYIIHIKSKFTIKPI